MKIEIIKATYEHAEEIAKNVRQDDENELWAASLITPERAMKFAIRSSELALTGLIDGKPVCMFGVSRESMMFNAGVPWLVGTKDLEVHSATFLVRCRRLFNKFFGRYSLLYNFVDERNTLAIKWLKWLGFKFSEKAEPHGYLGYPFYRFEMRRGSCAK